MKTLGKYFVLTVFTVGTFACSSGEKKQVDLKSNENGPGAHGVGPATEVSVGRPLSSLFGSCINFSTYSISDDCIN